MAKFDGFQCDACQKVWPSDKRTREVVRYEGFRQVGTFARDLCPECVVEPIGMTKISRGERSSKPPIPVPSATPVVQRTSVLGTVTTPAPAEPPPAVTFPAPLAAPPGGASDTIVVPSRPPILGIDYGVRHEE